MFTYLQTIPNLGQNLHQKLLMWTNMVNFEIPKRKAHKVHMNKSKIRDLEKKRTIENKIQF
jgi:hypothetical protein